MSAILEDAIAADETGVMTFDCIECAIAACRGRDAAECDLIRTLCAAPKSFASLVDICCQVAERRVGVGTHDESSQGVAAFAMHILAELVHNHGE